MSLVKPLRRKGTTFFRHLQENTQKYLFFAFIYIISKIIFVAVRHLHAQHVIFLLLLACQWVGDAQKSS